MFTPDSVTKLIDEALDRAVELFEQGSDDAPAIILGQLLRVDPKNMRAMQLLGLINYRRKSYSEAVEWFEKSLRCDPDNRAENYNNLALCYAGLDRLGPAFRYIHAALACDPGRHNYWSNLGMLAAMKAGSLGPKGRTAHAAFAKDCFRESLRIKGDNPEAWVCLGGLHGESHELEEAEAAFAKALELDPESGPAHVDLAYIHFLRGEWDKGWPHYEYRHGCFPQLRAWQRYYEPARRWDGRRPLDGKHLIVYCEQGAGDSIHFMRYLSLLPLTCRITVHCQEPLTPLFKQYGEVINNNANEPPPAYDYHASVVSLPYLLGFPEPPRPPYLSVPKGSRLAAYDDQFKIGIAWGGNPQHPRDRLRSCPLKYFRRLELPDVKLFSFQKDVRPRMYRFQKEPVDLTEGCDGMGVVNLADELADFGETAALVAELDLVVSVDTAVLHVAGAIGKKAWGLIAHNPDWRWSLAGDKTAWYPDVTLYRQEREDDWRGVFERVRKQLNLELQRWRNE